VRHSALTRPTSRKYKPLKAPAHCNGCQQRAVKRAYHTLCDACSKAQGKCAKCTELLVRAFRSLGGHFELTPWQTDENAMSVERDDGAAPRLPSEAELAEMSERQRRTALRKASQKPSSGATTPGGAVAATAAGQESMDEVDAQDDAEEDDDDDAEVEDDDEDDL